MEGKTISWTKKEVSKILDILHIPNEEWNGELNLGKTEKQILSQEDIKRILKEFCLLGSDGTTAKISENDSNTPIIVSGSIVIWGIEDNKTNTISYDNRIVIPGFNRLSHSTLRTILELRSALCILLARKLKSTQCHSCPFNNYGCQWQHKDFKPWEHFKGKKSVAIFDLPIIFSFVASLPTIDKDNREYLLRNIQLCFEVIRNYNLPVIFISQKSVLRIVSDELTSELDAAIDSLDTRAKALLDMISESINPSIGTLQTLVNLSQEMKNKFFTDYDLLAEWLENIGSPSPIFKVKPAKYNNHWEDLKFHYFSWGYQEFYSEDWVYFPSSWIRIGYSPALTPTLAHYIICLDMVLGMGHSISLTMAHTACNMHKHYHSKILVEYYNQQRPDKYKLGTNLKNINKWRLMSNG